MTLNHFGGICRGGPLTYEVWCDESGCGPNGLNFGEYGRVRNRRIAVTETLAEAEWWWRRHITEMEAKS